MHLRIDVVVVLFYPDFFYFSVKWTFSARICECHCQYNLSLGIVFLQLFVKKFTSILVINEQKRIKIVRNANLFYKCFLLLLGLCRGIQSRTKFAQFVEIFFEFVKRIFLQISNLQTILCKLLFLFIKLINFRVFIFIF